METILKQTGKLGSARLYTDMEGREYVTVLGSIFLLQRETETTKRELTKVTNVTIKGYDF